MEKKKRSYKDFLIDSGDDGVKRIALEYATENDAVSLGYLAEKYNLTLTAVKTIIEYSIVKCIVPFKVALFIKEKAHRNQARHCKDEILETSSDRYYKKLFNKRLSFVKKFSDDKVTNTVNFYIKNPHLSASTIADSLGLSVKELNIILKKAIVFDIIDNEEVNDLISVAIGKVDLSTSAVVQKTFDRYVSSRKFFKLLNSKIVELHFQLEVYDQIHKKTAEVIHQKELLESDLKKIQMELQQFIDSF